MTTRRQLHRGEVTRDSLGASPYIQESIAVVGIACRLPGDCNTPNALWEFLSREGVAQNTPPSTRFHLKHHYDGSTKPKVMRSPGGMFLENVDPRDIDAQFFGLSRVEATAMDPQQRQLLEVVYESLESAGISLEELSGQEYGCFVGSYASDYSDIQARDPENRAPLVTIGVGRAMLSNRISHLLNIKGSSMTPDTACSGSLVAVDVACRFLHTREINGAIVAGCNLYLNPEHNMDFGAMKEASSTSGRCHTFDAKADGYIKSEGVNTVVLKRLKDALRDGDPVRAIIRGSASNSDGYTPGIASPSSGAQAAVIRKAYLNAGIKDMDLTGFLECHGTGTQAGDPIEVAGVSSVFAPTRSLEQPLLIGSIKSNLGHSEPASGLSGLLKAVLALEHGIIPGNPTFETPNPKIDFQALKVRASRTASTWPDLPVRRASVNSFGYGGSNAHVVLDDASSVLNDNTKRHVSSFASGVDDLFNEDISDRPYVLLLSANDEESLRSYIGSLSKHLINPAVSITIRDLAYPMSARRSHHFYRAYLLTKTPSIDQTKVVYGKKTVDNGKIGFVFTGQGAQWSQMGQNIIQTFPVARDILRRLDEALQTVPDPPSWSLECELSQARKSEHLRLPVFSQPLVTALQIVQVSVLKSWGIRARCVVGHSSGEIAAAYTAGYLTAEEAIRVAYFRGKAASCVPNDSASKFGMLAVGLGYAQCHPYISGKEANVQVGCFNSPTSVTLSGRLQDLCEVKADLEKDGHFARLLQVNIAYHSTFVAEVGSIYENLLEKGCNFPDVSSEEATMFSSLTGVQMSGSCNSAYWRDNMTCPVKFEQATRKMVLATGGVDFLLEIGPSDALSGPIAQIKKSMTGSAGDFTYCVTSKRGSNAIDALFDVPGRLHLAGHNVSMAEVNSDHDHSMQPNVIVDLPAYTWNHSNKYWYEGRASKDWRFRKFQAHDLLGSKILGTSWTAPTWRKFLKVEDLPWLKDHKMGDELVFPAACYIAMAVESVYQAFTHDNNENKQANEYNYRFRNIKFERALVLQDIVMEHELLTVLTPIQGGRDEWHDFKINSQREGDWVMHCRGFVRITIQAQQPAPECTMAPLLYPVSSDTWYKAMEDAGYGFGPLFRKQIGVEAIAGNSSSRSTLNLSEPASLYPQSSYPMHPVNLDGCLQSGAPSLWLGHRSAVNVVLVPAIIDSAVISSPRNLPQMGIATSSRQFIGAGRSTEVRNYKSDIHVYNFDDGSPLVSVSELRYHELETCSQSTRDHDYTCIVWKPDITWISQDTVVSQFQQPPYHLRNEGHALLALQEVLDMIAHKKPTLRVLEANIDTKRFDSVWFVNRLGNRGTRAAYRQYMYVVQDADNLLEAQASLADLRLAECLLLDIAKKPEDFVPIRSDFDLVVMKASVGLTGISTDAVHNACRLLSRTGHLMILEYDDCGQGCYPSCKVEHFQTELAAENKEEMPLLVNGVDKLKCDSMAHLDEWLNDSGRHCVYKCNDSASEGLKSFRLATGSAENDSEVTQQIYTLQFWEESPASIKLKQTLKDYTWHAIDRPEDLQCLPPDCVFLVVEELYTSLFPTVSEPQWRWLQLLLNQGHQILWVTKGSQFEVTNPDNALIYGLSRTIRAEDPSIRLVTLDVESAEGENTPRAIDRVLKQMRSPMPKMHIESEYVERHGTLYVSRIQVDDLLNQAERSDLHGTDLQTESLHDSKTCIRFRCERLGIPSSLHFAHVSSTELPLEANHFVEVEIFAAGLNFKDIAVVMGIVPEDQYLLGLEGAGIIKRVGSQAGPYKVGQRVLVYAKGTFANRVQVSKDCIHLLPDSLTFEEAATLACTYLSSIHALFDVARIRKSQLVLIHSASGGVGIAALQLCRYVGAEIYVTVGTEAKRHFMAKSFSIPDDHIFASRSIDFSSELMRVTEGKGADVILNSLTGDLLDESWRCIADGGTMVELGKKDILDRNTLSMEPYGRNASFHAIDMSHRSISDATNARLLSQTFELLAQGATEPIRPITTFGFQDLTSAFRHMRSGTHIGKIVISSGNLHQINVLARCPQLEMKLREDGSYLIIGGLRGLCGSLALFMVRCGARFLTIVSRSGYTDDKSRGVLMSLEAMGCNVILITGDVTNYRDVEIAFDKSPRPVAGVIQGAMVLRDRTFDSMTVDEFHAVTDAKVRGTWNLHNATVAREHHLDFFTMLSSISGVAGQKGQANYAAANVFLDSFASYRKNLGLRACAIDLGVIEDVGYAAERAELAARLDATVWVSGINEGLLHKILKLSILQQTSPINTASASQLITGIPVPQEVDSTLLRDARFAGLCLGDDSSSKKVVNQGSSRDIQAISILVKSKADPPVLRNALIDVINKQFTKSLGLEEPMEPTKTLASYGLDSLGAVEIRNWARLELGAELTTLEVANAKSLSSLCDRIVEVILSRQQ